MNSKNEDKPFKSLLELDMKEHPEKYWTHARGRAVAAKRENAKPKLTATISERLPTWKPPR